MNRLFTILLWTVWFSSAGAGAAEITGIEGLEAEQLKNDYLSSLLKDNVTLIDLATAITVKGQEVRLYDLKSERQMASKPFSLPKACHQVAFVSEPGRRLRSLYCFGGRGKGDVLQLYGGGGKFTPILKTPKSISAIAGGQNRLFFVSQDGLFQLRAGEKIHPVFVSSFLSGVNSMAFDADTDVLYLSTPKEIYALRAGTLDLIAQGAGGRLLLAGRDLIVVQQARALRFKDVGAFLAKTKP